MVSSKNFSREEIDNFGVALNDKSRPLAARFRALFVLRNINCDQSVEWIGKCLKDESALLKHELAYCLGQLQNPSAIPILVEVLKDESQEPMVRHEAGEALGAIAHPSVKEVLLEFSSDPCPEVSETCQIALERIEWVEKNGKNTESPYDSVDPTPAATSNDVEELGATLVDPSRSLFERYRAMFSLRNFDTRESIKALAQGLYCEDSALFRHEVAYVLGQLQSPVAIKELSDRLFLDSENCMVRHECAEALGAIATDECTEILKKYSHDQERVVRESCEVALDMAKYENSGDLQYAKLHKVFWNSDSIDIQMKARLQQFLLPGLKLRPTPINIRQFSLAAVKPAFSSADLGKMYEIDKNTAKQLNLAKYLPSPLAKQMDTLDELVTLVRSPFLEILACMRVVDRSLPSLRLVLWGAFGTGKTVTLNQAVHHAQQNGWLIVQLRSAMDLTRNVSEVEMSTFASGRINDPTNAVVILQDFKQQNQAVWKRLAEAKTSRDYEWSKSERTPQGKPLVDIVEMGISAPYLATDCVGALFRELRLHSSNAADLKVLVAIDDANSLWGKTLVKRADRTFASPSDLSLVVHYRRLIANDWTNGCVLLVADKKEIADARKELEVSRNTPLELFGEEGFEFIEPFLPIETSQYTEEEANTMYKYYVEKNWLTTPNARSEEGRRQLMHLSAFNPYYYERLCAFN
ncbi:unnamed protein product [Caenorhabditis auriculariae]|uniref:Deoxyhypusine hydroxylase n=1 Tax=Caenorhabditis auriculariae TaxID=2777116 RepID=A0A8S1HJS0_9PELO|nr:unnamed protein product [Caenorhabditis auriculariae]